MARSRESVRQNKAMQSILRGETPEQRVMVGYDKKPESNHGDKIDRLSDIIKEEDARDFVLGTIVRILCGIQQIYPGCKDYRT